METLKRSLLLTTVLLLAACGGKPNDTLYKGKTAQEWAEIAENYRGMAERTQSAPTAQASPQKAEPTEAELAEKQGFANAGFLASAADQSAIIASSKDGKIVVEAAQVGLGEIGTAEISLNKMAGLFLTETMKKVLPEVRGENFFGPDYKVVNEGRGKVRQAIVKWLTDDLNKRLDVIWTAVRPMLRQKYSLLNTLRGQEKLFKTTYTPKGFAPLYECLQWHQTLIYAQGDTPPASPTPKDKENCNKIFKSFGVEGVDFGVKQEDTARDRGNIAFDNVIWTVEFLKRREADGGQVFAQKFQHLASDYIK